VTDDTDGTHLPRLFIAVPLPEDARRAVADLVARIRAEVEAADEGRNAPVRWVRMDGIHLTLRFLGPAPVDRVPSLGATLDGLAGDHGPIDLRIGGGGAFPTPQRPRTLWLAVSQGEQALQAVATDLAARLVASGWPPEERPFRPHLTLARADGRRAGPATARALIRHATGFDLSFTADRVTLFESVTGGGPARYVALHGTTFGGPRRARETPA
jgi:RNA 2',3'-cyclic 3'-phosphodiesterase